MMVDKHVHFHVLPRYASPRQALGMRFVDQHWPKPPVLGDILKMDAAQHLALAGRIVALPRIAEVLPFLG